MIWIEYFCIQFFLYWSLLLMLKPGPCTNNNVAWQLYRSLDLYHRCMEKVIAEINDHCSEDRHFRFADGKVREGQCFWHLLSMDGLEISYTAMCPTNDCPVCERPKDELDRTDKSYYHLCGTKSNLWSKQLRQSCWISTGASRTAAKSRYPYFYT